MNTILPVTQPLRLEQLPDLLTVGELADFLRIGRSKAYKLVRESTLPAIRLGNAVRVPKTDLIDFLRLEVEASRGIHE